MAAHNPLPHEMVERVLLSPDLVPHILGPLEAEDGAAAAVCSQWLTGWKATNEPRRRLKQVPFDLLTELDTRSGLQMAVTPDGRLVVCAGAEVHILDSSMHALQTVANGSIAASDDSFFYASYDPPVLLSSPHDGTVHAEYQLEGFHFYCPVLAPGGLLFCVIFEDEDILDEIIALDAQTMQLRYRFGRGLLNDANHLAVAGDELYVCDTGNHRLQVFSLTGEHRRSITGEWRSPVSLCVAKDRLYLIEQDAPSPSEGEDEDTTQDTNPLHGRRILVLSLQGDILQVVTHPTEPTAGFTSICCFDHKLLASYCNMYRETVEVPWKYEILALQGLSSR